MPNVKSFNDTSSVSLAYALGAGTTSQDFSGEDFSLIPFTTEGFQMSKEPKQSTAIRGDRRPANSKNTKGTASGAATVEFGATPFVMDMLSAAMMSEWKQVDPVDPVQGTYITDSDLKKYLCVEKTSRSGPAPTDIQYHERYYGSAVNDATLEFGDGELVTLALNLMSATADYAEAAQGVNGLGGSIALSKLAPEDYEIADSSNNLKSVKLFDSEGQEMQVVFTDLSLQIQNNVREQSGLGHEFAAGMGIGKVAVSVSGDIYFVDHTMLKAHMKNDRLSAEFTIETREGTFKVQLPNLMVQTPTNSAEGENQDYMTSLTLQAEAGKVTIGGEEVDCVIAITYKAAD